MRRYCQYLCTWGGVFLVFMLLSFNRAPKPVIGFCGAASNDLYLLLKQEGYQLKRFDKAEDAVKKLSRGTPLLIVADAYPSGKTKISPAVLQLAAKKKMKVYAEYPAALPGVDISDTVVVTQLERGVVTGTVFGDSLKPMSLLGINDCHVLPAKADTALVVLAKVAGFDRAEYGIEGEKTYPVLFTRNNLLIATTKLTNFRTGRYGPAASWKTLWEYIITWMTDREVKFSNWPQDLNPSYSAGTPLPSDARRNSVVKGAEWFYKGRFFIHPGWKEMWLRYQGDGTAPFGPPVSQQLPSGDGSLGVLEGHASRIYHDGTEQYRYWVRNDVQGEVAYAMASAGKLLNKSEYYQVASNLADYIFVHSTLRAGPRAHKDSAVYGLVGWSLTHPYIFYNDDNARSILGLIGASGYMNTGQWDLQIAENIMANFRTSSRQGFQGGHLTQQNIQKNGWEYYHNRDFVNPHPHFESWMWACYLWLYDKTGYKPLLDKARTAIRLTMEAYPDKWKWTNGIQQERARMILPLAWLVRVEDTPEHRGWLDKVAASLLDNQVECGAIREELGRGKGLYGTTPSNKEYGLHEAPLIFKNGDKVADMLYTSNFAFFALNEAARATGDQKYTDAVARLSDFLTRVQVQSEKHPDIDGAWFRAFDYGRWDYWASNADAGWGAWSTLTGWIQSWIVATQVLIENKQSFWEATRHSAINKQMPQVISTMLGE